MTYDHFTSLSLEIGNNSTDIHDVLQLFTTSERIEWYDSEILNVVTP